VPKFAKRYADLATNVKDALTRYTDEVRSGAFPEPQHVFKMDDDQRARIVAKRKS
jgi:3-methyl-2-oxobutanoate hydroxymethyltransferase